MKKFLIIFSVCVLSLIIIVVVRSCCISYYYRHNIINEIVDFPINFETDPAIIDISQLKEEYILLYFEDSTQSNKDQKKIQSVYKSRLMQDDRVKIYAIPSGGNETLLKNLKIKSFPAALIISKDGTEMKIRCRGSLAVAVDCLLALTYAYAQ